MLGVILAGGLAKRLNPITTYINKHMAPVFDRPMICYPIQTLVSAGIKNVAIIVSGPFSGQVISFIKDGKHLGLEKVTYLFQDKPDGGIADALSLAEEFAGNDNVCVILGDNCLDDDISKVIASFKNDNIPKCHLFVKKVSNAKDFGVASLNGNFITKIIEKPENPETDLAVLGIYIYDNNVFKFIKNIQPSERNQLEITDVNNLYITNGEVSWTKVDGFWQDAGTPEKLFLANQYWYNKYTKNFP